MASEGGEWRSMSLGNNGLALCHNIEGTLNCEYIDPPFLNYYFLPNSSTFST